MLICKSLIYEILNNFKLLPLILLFIIMGCHHDPGHPPTNGGSTSACAPIGAAWVNEPEREGSIKVKWYAYGGVLLPPPYGVSVVARNPLSGGASSGGLASQLNLSSRYIKRSADDLATFSFCCGTDTVAKARLISQGTETTLDFDGTSSTESVLFDDLRHINAKSFINVGTWIVANCQRTKNWGYPSQETDIPISVLTQCRRSDGTEYEVETTLLYKTFSKCEHTWPDI